LVYAALTLVFLGPGLLPGHTISASDLLWTATPWTELRPESVRLFGSNGELVDPVTVMQVFQEQTRERLPDIPLWNPQVMGGRPFLANMQSAVFGPFTLPAYVLPFWWSLSLIGALKIFVAAMGTFLLGRALGMGFAGALLAGVVFAFGLFFVAWLPWPLTAVWALLPWLLLATDRLIRRPGPLTAAALAVLVGLQFFGGHPESSFHALFATSAFFVLRVIQLRPRDGTPARFALRPLLFFAGGLVAGGALAAVVIVPFLELVAHSGDLARRDDAAPARVERKYLVAALLGDWWGRPTQAPLAGYQVERAFYAGALPLLLAGAALLRPRVERFAVAAFGAGALAVVVGTPPLFQIVTSLPGFSSAYNTRMAILFLLSVALLAGWGLDDLATERPDRRRAAVLLGLAAALLVVPAAWALGTVNGLGDHVGPAVRAALAAGDPPTDDAAAAQVIVRGAAILVWVTFAGAAAALLFARTRWRLAGGVFAALAVLLTAGDLFRAGMGQNPAITTAEARQPVTPAIRYLRSRTPGRFVGALPVYGALPIPPDVAMRYGLYDARGYDYPVERRFDEVWRRHVAPPTSIHPPITVAQTTPRALRVLSLFGVRDVLQQPREKPLQAPGLRVAYRGPDATIYANDRALPRVWLAGAQRVVAGERAARETIADAGFDPRRTVVTERRLGGLPEAGTPAARTDAGTATLVSYEPERVRVRLRARRAAELVLSDVHYPGWRAEVDGKAAELHRVDYLFRGVRVPPGEHVVEMRYAPASWRAGWIISLLGLAAIVAAAVVGLRRRRRDE
jgi:hypothetical protein